MHFLIELGNRLVYLFLLVNMEDLHLFVIAGELGVGHVLEVLRLVL